MELEFISTNFYVREQFNPNSQHLSQAWPCLVYFFSSLITPHSIFVTRHSSLIIQNTPISYTHPFGTHYLTCHHSNFSTFCGPRTYNLVRAKLLAYPWKVSSPFFFSFLISPSPFSPHTLPKHKPEPITPKESPSPISTIHRQWAKVSVNKHS